MWQAASSERMLLTGCCPVKEGEPERDCVEVETQLWGKPNKVMANLMGSCEMSLFIRVSISGRNGQLISPPPLVTGCPRKGGRGRSS